MKKSLRLIFLGVIFSAILFFLPCYGENQIKLSYKEKNDDAEEFLKAKTEKDLLAIPGAVKTHYPYKSKYKWQFPFEIIDSTATGYIHRPNSEIRHIEKFEDELIYDAIYRFDKYSRRENPIPITSRHEEYVAFFGCSFTYGNGLNDDETIHYHLTENSSSIYAYNYSIGASGPHMLLALLNSSDIKKQIPIGRGSFIYIYNSFHIRRSNLFLIESIWTGKTPFFKRQGGQLVQQGTLAEEHPLTIQFFNCLRWASKIFSYHVNFPKVSDHHRDYVCDLISASRDSFEQKNPTSQFYVYSHPISSMDSYLSSCLAKKNVKVWASKIEINKEKHLIPGDDHPNSFLNSLIAQEILEKLVGKN